MGARTKAASRPRPLTRSWAFILCAALLRSAQSARVRFRIGDTPFTVARTSPDDDTPFDDDDGFVARRALASTDAPAVERPGEQDQGTWHVTPRLDTPPQ